jgi:hypothetical protein
MIHKNGELRQFGGRFAVAVLNVPMFAPKMQLLLHGKQLNSKIFNLILFLEHETKL